MVVEVKVRAVREDKGKWGRRTRKSEGKLDEVRGRVSEGKLRDGK